MVEPAPSMRVQRTRRKEALQRVAIGVAITLLAGTLGGAGWAYLLLQSAQKTMHGNAQTDRELETALDKRVPHEPFTVLLLGQDKRPGDEAARADTIIVARIDPEDHKVWMLSIPRDTRVQIPGQGTQKINAATFYGGPALMVETVQEFLGIPVNHYMDIDFDGFIQVVDSLGGVYIDVDQEIDDPKASSHGSRTAGHIEAGYQLLDGEHALTFVRSRDFPDADFTRMRHQQQFFKALADQATKLGNALKIPGMAKEVAQYMSTDMSLAQIVDVALALRDMGSSNVQAATVMGEWKSPYVWPDLERKEFLVNAMIEGRSFEDTSTAEVSLDRSAISITVRNGAGIEGCASYTANLLRGKGYAVGEVSNANQFVYDETLVVYKTDRAAAVQAASDLPKARVVESRGMYAFSTDVLVVVGKDFPTWGTGK
jgi:LCP family protein required for cell wall assembly